MFRVCHLLLVGVLLTPFATGRAAKGDPGKGLRLRNRTPFMLTVYIGGVRSGWIKPFRTEVFSGLKGGRHKVFVASHYGSVSWGPRRVQVPGTWNLTPPKDAKATDELEQALAARIYRRNRSSLTACDRLAERRGEELTGRAELEIKVDEKGKAAVTVTGEKLSRRTQACYRAVAATWEYPATGAAYEVTFQHMR